MEASPSPMAESEGFSSRPSSKRRHSSAFLKHFSLHDWWLIKTETSSPHHNLGVGGLVSDPKRGLRIFNSASILKWHSSDVLEDSGGLTITIVGSINRARTISNGFTSEVLSHFLCGFPYYWEDYAGQSLPYGSKSRSDGPNSFEPISIHDLHFSCQVCSSLTKSAPLSKKVSISEIPMSQNGESTNQESTPNLNPKTQKETLKSIRLETEGVRKDDCFPSIIEKNDGSVGGKSVSVACMTTRKLTLRSRSIDMHIN